jgi:DNA invertase Pin-like site-specific DNA recombinase
MYLRQSKDAADDEKAVSRQRQDCEAVCRAKGWSWTEYPDNDRSATNFKPRPKYQLMLDQIRAGKVDAVVVWDLDRLHRQPIELEYFMKLADERRLKLATATGDCDLATDNGRLFARIKGAVAMSEVERKSARQKRASKQMAETDARPWWPSRPFGYTADPDPTTKKWWTVKRDPSTKVIIAVNKIRKHPKEAKLLKDAYTAFNAGATIRSIATGWNRDGIASPRGKRWTGSAVHALLASARNAGLREYNGELVKGADGAPKKGTWPAIVTEAVWRQAHGKLKDPKRRIRTNAGRKYLLSGIARCGVCAKGWKDKDGVYHEPADVALGTGINSRGLRQYACVHCYRINRHGGKVDDLVTDRVVWRLSRPDAVKLLESDEQDVDTAALREDRRALNDRLVQLGKDFATADPAFVQSALADINGKLAAINDVLEAPAKVDIYEGVIGAKDVRKAFTGLDLGRQRTIVDALMTITVKPVGKRTGAVFDEDAIDLVWRVPVKD